MVAQERVLAPGRVPADRRVHHVHRGVVLPRGRDDGLPRHVPVVYVHPIHRGSGHVAVTEDPRSFPTLGSSEDDCARGGVGGWVRPSSTGDPRTPVPWVGSFPPGV